MTRIQHGSEFVEYNLESIPFGVIDHKDVIAHKIDIINASINVFEKIEISNTILEFDGKKFPLDFKTKGLDHMFSVIGQFQLTLDEFVKETFVEHVRNTVGTNPYEIY